MTQEEKPKKKPNAKPKKKPKVEWVEEVIQIGPSLHLDENGDPAPPPYKRYVVVKRRKRK